MGNTTRRIDLRQLQGERLEPLLRREWLVTNGLGGYASGTLSGCDTWRYHGLLIAALPVPFGRMVMLNHVSESIRFADGRLIQFGGDEPKRIDETRQAGHHVTEFRLENGLPVWRYDVEGTVLEKHVLMLYGQNTVHIGYRLLFQGEQLGPIRLELRPSIHFRGHDHAVDKPLPEDGYDLRVRGAHYEVSTPGLVPRLRVVMRADRSSFVSDGTARREMFYQKEADRGYASRGTLWSPGYFALDLQSGVSATLVASTEWWSTMLAIEPEEALAFHHERHRRLIDMAAPPARGQVAADLVLAADQFIITPASRVQDTARAHASGDEVRTVIAGYHWFTDWGRDTMISFEGLTLTTGRFVEAGWILRTFAHYIREGLIPNLFPEGRSEGLYHTADATLWFFHALDRYVELTGDRLTLRLVLPKLVEIVQWHLRGTRFGITVDPGDGLLVQGAPGYQLTWMDAKVGDWVVTPRRGKAVEVNGLWYNALRLLEGWLREEQDTDNAARLGKHADQARLSFNQKFWYPAGNHLYDVVEGEHGNDCALRPNQLLSFSLKHPVLREDRWKPVLDIVRDQLVTPVGLRSLSRSHPDYKAKYFGDLRARDAAYHQGTVWAWLIGPFLDAWLRVYPEDKTGARRFLDGFAAHLDEGCVGSINEVFDAEAPFTPRGCIAQAWSVAEVLRCWCKTAEG